jgi:hypothetical protein
MLSSLSEEDLNTEGEDGTRTPEQEVGVVGAWRRPTSGSGDRMEPEQTTRTSAAPIEDDHTGNVDDEIDEAPLQRGCSAPAGNPVEEITKALKEAPWRSSSTGTAHHPLMLAGIGGAVMLQATPTLSLTLSQALTRSRRVMIDIEDLNVEHCLPPPEEAKRGARAPDVAALRRRADTAPMKTAAAAAKSQSHSHNADCALALTRSARRSSDGATGGCGKRMCAYSAKFSGCALCRRKAKGNAGEEPSGHVLPFEERCVACQNGVCVIAKNTFLTLADSDDEKEKERGSRRRCKSL